MPLNFQVFKRDLIPPNCSLPPIISSPTGIVNVISTSSVSYNALSQI